LTATINPYALFTAIPLVGHVNPLLRQAKELQNRGWRVAFAGFRDVRDHVAAEAPGVAFVDLGELGPLREGLQDAMRTASKDPSFARGAMRITRAVFSLWLPMFDALKRAVAADPPDIMVVDLFSSAGLAVADTAHIPAVVNNPDLLAAIPVTLLPPADHLPFLFSGRSVRNIPWHQPAFTGLLTRKLAAAVVSLTTDRDLNALRRRRGLSPTTAHNLLDNRLVLVNGAFGLEYDRPLPPGVEMVGPMLGESVPALPADLEAWLNEGSEVVYANMGTLVEATPDHLRKMMEALNNARFRSLWILSPAQAALLPKSLPDRLRVMPWGPPPLAVLSHPNVKAFVSHCGINNAHEAIVAGTPIVGIPMFADQRDMAVRLCDAGVGLWVDKRRFTVDSLLRAIERVLDEPSFTLNIPALQEAIRKSGGVRRAASLIERAAAQGQFRPA
jgi:MGT family glycosyltransferase